MRRVRAKFRYALSLVAIVGAACDGDGFQDAIMAPELSATLVPGPSAGYLPGWSDEHYKMLEPLLEREKARIAFEQERSKAAYDSLKLEWDAFLAADHERDESPFLMCDPLQYTGETKIIGPEGGDLGTGPHKLSIPQGALSQYTVVTVEAPVSSMAEVKLSPHGLTFLRQPALLLSYKHCYLPEDFMDERRLAYVDADGNILEWPVSYDRSGGGDDDDDDDEEDDDDDDVEELLGWIWHFSRYVVVKKGYTPAGG